MVRFCTYNARGLNNFQKRKQLFTLCKAKGLDVVFLQETHAKREDISFWRSQWGGHVLFANGTSDSRGVMILIRRDLDFTIDNTISDEEGRFIITEMQIEECQFVLCDVYAPNSDSPNFFNRVHEIIESYDNSNIIYSGDFNFVINNSIDRKFSHHNNDKARNAVLEYCRSKELIDVWRKFNPEKREYSCCRPNSESSEWKKFSRLDMFFVSQGLFNSIRKCLMQTGFQSDHSFVIFDIDIQNESRGPSYWKFNNSFLYNKEFILGANMVIEEAKIENFLAPDLKWEKVKGAFTEFSKRYGKDQAKTKNQKFNELQEQLDKIKSLVEDLPNCDPNTHDEYDKIKREMQDFISKKTQGIVQ